MQIRIALVSTGGTIEMKRGREGLDITDEYNPLPMDGDVVPEHIHIDHLKFSGLPSPQITPAKMGELCRLLGELTSGGHYDGVVVTHGTDTLEETAFLADIWLDTEKPVVFTAAMRSLSEMGVDGPRNLRGALLTAATPEVHELGVTVVLNDEIHSAGRVTKNYTSNLSSFSSPGYGPLGFVDQDRVLLHRAPLWRVHLPPGELMMDYEVGLVRVAAGFGHREVLHCLEDGYRGLVIEALGRGNVPPLVAEAAEEVASKGIIVCVTSRCYVGRVLGVYDYIGGGVDLEKRGLILAGDMQGHKLRLFLMASLGMGLSRNHVSELLDNL
jgi:L-asparaginase